MLHGHTIKGFPGGERAHEVETCNIYVWACYPLHTVGILFFDVLAPGRPSGNPPDGRS
jgi:hypothetical protein